MRWPNSQRAERGHLPHIRITCEECGWRAELAARLGEPGHELGDTVHMVCPGCESVLAAEIGRELHPGRV
jgi:RNase P subunit RPR2